METICISASNMVHSGEDSVSMAICRKIEDILHIAGADTETVDLRRYDLSPCTGCGGCHGTRRCENDPDFNRLYEKLVDADGAVFVSPHYAPIPAKLCMLLEKMEEITFLHWWRDSAYRSEVYGKPAGIISHGGGSDWALKSYKAMVNDTIANALDTIQFKTVAYNGEWDTGISLPVAKVSVDGFFPAQSYDWEHIERKLSEYVKIFLSYCGAK